MNNNNDDLNSEYVQDMVEDANALLGTNFTAKLVSELIAEIKGNYLEIRVDFDAEEPVSATLTEKTKEIIGTNFYQTEFHMEMAFLSAISQATKFLLSNSFLLDSVLPIIGDHNEGQC